MTARLSALGNNGTDLHFARPHKTPAKPYPTTPAMAAGVCDHIWAVEEIVPLIG